MQKQLTMRLIFFFFLLLTAMGVVAQNKIDFAGRTLPDDSLLTYNAIVEFNDKDAGFGDCRVDVVSRHGFMAVVNATLSQIKKIAELPQVVSISVGQEQRPLSDSVATDSVAVANPEAVNAEPAKKKRRSLWDIIKSIFK